MIASVGARKDGELGGREGRIMRGTAKKRDVRFRTQPNDPLGHNLETTWNHSQSINPPIFCQSRRQSWVAPLRSRGFRDKALAELILLGSGINSSDIGGRKGWPRRQGLGMTKLIINFLLWPRRSRERGVEERRDSYKIE